MTKKSHENFKIMHNVFDDFTNRTIFSLIGRGQFEGLQSPIKIGKEANVFTANKDNGRVAVKIYRLENCDFNKMFDYIKEDQRYINLKGKKRKIVFAWVQREYRNLFKAREAGVRVPTPRAFLNNVLVMDFIGDKAPAPQLKNALPENKEEFFEEVIENMKKLFDAGLIHADLSAFNILNHEGHPVFIDFSQCSSLDTSRSNEFLDRDIENVLEFFRKIGLKKDPLEIKKRIIGKHKI